ncbi:MAG: hypothetical protein WC728_12660 [Elusimicrobiota bacterium]
MRPFIAPILLASLAAPACAEFALTPQSIERFSKDLDLAFAFTQRALDPQAEPRVDAEDKDPCAGLDPCLARVESALGSMLSAFGPEERKTREYTAIAQYQTWVQAARANLSPDLQATYQQHLLPMAEKQAELLALLRSKTRDEERERKEPKDIGKGVQGRIKDLAPVQKEFTAGDTQGMGKFYDNSGLAPGADVDPSMRGLAPKQTPGGTVHRSDFVPPQMKSVSFSDTPLDKPNGSIKAGTTGRVQSSFDRALTSLPLIPEGLKKDAKIRLFKENEKAFAEKLKQKTPPGLDEESKLKDRLSRALQKKTDPKELEALWNELGSLYKKYPDLARYRQDREAHRRFLTDALRQGAVPDGWAFDPADLGMSVDGRLVKKTYAGVEGLLLMPPAGSKANRVFESLDGRMIREFKGDVVATRYLREDGKPSREVIRKGDKVSTSTYRYDGEGRLIGQRIEETGGTTKALSYDPLTGAVRTIVEEGADGESLTVTRFLAGNKVEITDKRKRMVQRGEMGPDGRVRVTSAVIEGTKHAVLVDKKGNVVGAELSWDKKTGKADLSGMVKAGFLTQSEADQLASRFPTAAALMTDSGTGSKFLTPPQVVFGPKPNGPTLIYEMQSPHGNNVLTSHGFDKNANGWVASSRYKTKGAGSFETIQVFRGWNEREKRFTSYDDYRTTFVTRYEPMRGHYSSKETALTQYVWDAGAKGWKKTREDKPQADGIFDVVTKNISWTFSNVPVYKQVGQGIGVVADGGKFVGYTLTGGTGELIGKVSGSKEHTVYGVVSKYQGIAWAKGAGGAMMMELREKMGKEDFEARRNYWVSRYKESLLKQPMSPQQKFSLQHGKLDVTDDELGSFLVHGGGGEGFGGAGREFAKYASESDTKLGKAGWGLAAANVYAADFTFQSLGFNAMGAAFGSLSKTAKTAQTAEKLTAMGRTAIALDKTAKGVQIAQGAYFDSLIAMQGLELGSAFSKGDSEKAADSLCQLAALGIMPRGRELKPGESTSLNPKRMLAEVFTTSPLASMVIKSGEAKPYKPEPASFQAKAQELAEGLGYDPTAKTFRLSAKKTEVKPLEETPARIAQTEGRSPVKLSLADKYIGTNSKQQARTQELRTAVETLNQGLERPIEIEYKKSPTPVVDAAKLYITHAKNGGMKGLGYVTNAGAAIVGGIAQVPVEGVKMNKSGDIIGASASGHSNVSGLFFAALSRLTNSNKPGHETLHVFDTTLLAGAQQKGLITGREALQIQNGRPGLFGYAWGGRSEKAAVAVEHGSSLEWAFRNLELNARDHFTRTSATPEAAKARYDAFCEHIRGRETLLRAQYPDLFTTPAPRANAYYQRSVELDQEGE